MSRYIPVPEPKHDDDLGPDDGYYCDDCVTHPFVAHEDIAEHDRWHDGEVETPCATCRGTKRKRVTVSENPRIPSKYRPCPDCGVETPEAAVEASDWGFDFDNVIGTREGSQVANHLLRELMVAMGVPTAARPDTPRDVWLEMLNRVAQGWTPPGTERPKISAGEVDASTATASDASPGLDTPAPAEHPRPPGTEDAK